MAALLVEIKDTIAEVRPSIGCLADSVYSGSMVAVRTVLRMLSYVIARQFNQFLLALLSQDSELNSDNHSKSLNL